MITLKNIEPNCKYLLAVSGGIDSMVMAHVFINANVNCAIAHCNFTLRGKESDADEDLVRNFAQNNHIPFYTVKFETEKYAQEKGISIQIAARELRYQWFEEVRNSEGFTKIAIAHNADDNIETFFINLSRGAGLNGLTGIPVNTSTLVRPIIEASRKQIEEYAALYHVPYREDASNASTKYLRNKIRHLVLPVFDNIDPLFRKKATESINYLAEANNYFKIETNNFINTECFYKTGDLYIPFESIKKLHSQQLMLFYILEPYGFKGDVISNILNSIENAVSGKQFYSHSHCLITDRENLIISEIPESFQPINIYEDSDIELNIGNIKCEVIAKNSTFKLTKDKSIGEFDFSKLVFPLTLRSVEAGDWFIPIGMKGRKKLSDFFIDIKLPLTEKKKQTVLLSGNDIVWVTGLRPDDRFKITDETKKVWRISLKN